MRPDHEQEHLRELTADLKTGRMTRGQFVSKALAMGISLTAAAKLLDANPALAHNKAEQQLQAAGKTYQYWTPFAGADGPHMKLMADVYNSKNPGTYFNFVRVGGGYETKMTSAAISKTLPDVAAYRADWIPDAVARGIFEPIDDIASQQQHQRHGLPVVRLAGRSAEQPPLLPYRWIPTSHVLLQQVDPGQGRAVRPPRPTRPSSRPLSPP